MNPYLRIGLGDSTIAVAALIAGLVALVVVSVQPWVRWIERRSRRAFPLALAAAAFLLSVGYVDHYLRGGPRIVDATYYYLEARALARGLLSFAVPDPTAAFGGRFLLVAPGDRLAVLFPPGYPAALALGFVAGLPLAIGPALAAALVLATRALALSLGATPPIALGAAALSTLCAALRYHTADTMSHGLAALLLSCTVAFSARGTAAAAVGAGIASGWLIATRPVTGICALGAAVFLCMPGGARNLALLSLGVLPGGALLLLHQHAATGDWLRSTQLAYYALADGPPGCFRYGFGEGIGCQFEHGDFVRARLADGYGFGAALGNTGRRLLLHSVDIANAAPLALAVPVGMWAARGSRAARAGVGVVLAVIAGYAPFYFEGSYPGGGARLFADVLPFQHVFVALGLSRIAALRFAWPAALLGFALHSSHQHALLRDREGGRPMFEAGVLASAGIERGLVFVGTDHGFALGHEPDRLSASAGVVVAREHHDALDRLLWESLGRPAAYRYEFDPSAARAEPHLSLLAFEPRRGDAARIEAESLWPPRSVEAGWAHPAFTGEPCASRGRGLRLIGRESEDSAVVEIAMPGTTTIAGASERRVPNERVPTDELVIGWVGTPDDIIRVSWPGDPLRPRMIEWERAVPKPSPSKTGPAGERTSTAECLRSRPLGPIVLSGGFRLHIEARGLLDYVELKSPESLTERR